MTDRPSASAITDPELDALYAELDHAEPVAHQLACRCGASAEDDTAGVSLLFASSGDARRWARAHDWLDDPGRGLLLCPGCAEEQRHADDHAGEIAAAIRYATEETR